jgi:hypothetical protein
MATRTWQRIQQGNTPSGNWSNTAHWVGGVVPVAGDDVVFPLVGAGDPAYVVTLDILSTPNLNSVSLTGASATLAVGANTLRAVSDQVEP